MYLIIIITPLGGSDKDSHNGVVIIPEQDGLMLNRKDIIRGKNAGEQFIRYEDIISIGYAKKGLLLNLGTLTIMTIGGKIKLINITPKEGNRFVSSIQQILTSVKSKTNESNIVQQQISPMEEIKKAKELLDNGIITEEEFNKLKNKYLI